MRITDDGLNWNKFLPRRKFILTLEGYECTNLDINKATSLFPCNFQDGVRNRLIQLQGQNEFNILNHEGKGLWVIFEFNGNTAEGPWIYQKSKPESDDAKPVQCYDTRMQEIMSREAILGIMSLVELAADLTVSKLILEKSKIKHSSIIDNIDQQIRQGNECTEILGTRFQRKIYIKAFMQYTRAKALIDVLVSSVEETKEQLEGQEIIHITKVISNVINLGATIAQFLTNSLSGLARILGLVAGISYTVSAVGHGIGTYLTWREVQDLKESIHKADVKLLEIEEYLDRLEKMEIDISNLEKASSNCGHSGKVQNLDILDQSRDIKTDESKSKIKTNLLEMKTFDECEIPIITERCVLRNRNFKLISV